MLKRQTISVADTTISYIQAGSGNKIIICMHGFGASTRYFKPLIKELSKTHTVYSPDQPDFGKSGDTRQTLSIPALAQFYDAFASQLGLKNMVLVANSMGCQVAVDWAAKTKAPIQSLVLIGPTVNPRERSTLKQLWRWLQDGRHEPASGGKLLRKDYRAAGLRRLVRTLRHTVKDKIEEKLPLVRQPILVIRGDKDPLCPQYWAEEVTRLAPTAELTVIPGAGHATHFAKPLETAAAINQFIA